MSRQRRRAKQYREPNDREMAKVIYLGYPLEELFYLDEIEDFLTTANQAIAGEFFYATELNPRFKPNSNMKLYRRTDNYIIGVGSRPSDLARMISVKSHRKIVPERLLPGHLREMQPKLVERLINRARYDVVLLAVNALIEDGQIRYDEALSTWHVCQSNVDGFLQDKSLRKKSKRAVKRDDRSWHGLPTCDRGGVPGVSVSHA